MKDFNFEIWRMQAQSDIKGIVATLKDSNPANRRAAATAIRALGATTAIPSVQDALLQESDPELRELLVTTLESLFAQNNEGQVPKTSDNRNIVRLIARLSGNHTEQAIRAAQELGDSREKLTVEALLMTFNNRKMSPRVRLAVAEALLKLQSAPAEITLLAALRNERWMIRRNAAAVLGQLQSDWAVEPLIQALRDPIEAVRKVARAALERIGTPEALAVIQAPEVPADEHPQKSPTQEMAIVKIIPDSPVVADSTPVEPAPNQPESKPLVGGENPPQQPSESTNLYPEGIASPAAAEGVKAAILDEPPPSEEDTKPIRPLPDDVS